MSADDPRLYPRPGSVIAETLGDETMVIDTESGVFYSLRGIASALWSVVERGSTAGELAAAACEHYPGDDRVDAAAREFFAALTADGLIGPDPSEPPSAAHPVWPAAFAPPVLEAHRDMNDLLLVDPLHDVDDTGWPRRAS